MDLKKILIGAVVVYVIISVWVIGTPYIKNVMFADEVDNIARFLSIDGTVQQAKSQLEDAIRRHEVNVTEDDYVIIRDEERQTVVIDVKYSVQVTTPFGLYTHTWRFNPRATHGIASLPGAPTRQGR